MVPKTQACNLHLPWFLKMDTGGGQYLPAFYFKAGNPLVEIIPQHLPSTFRSTASTIQIPHLSFVWERSIICNRFRAIPPKHGERKKAD
jgi:hypothetical protein